MVQLADSTGTLTKTYAYDAFGNQKNISTSDTNPFRYSGEYFDKETGTVYLRARYYDPEMGRFLTEDSYLGKVNDPLSLNLYTYCGNNPIRYIDPSGHESAVLTHMSTTGDYSIDWHVKDVTETELAVDMIICQATLMLVPEAMLAELEVEAGLGTGLGATTLAARGTSNAIKGGSEALFDWKLIKATQPVIEGTNVPRSFVINGLKVNGKNVWVGGNATKHIGEFVNSANKAGGGLLSESEIMNSFMNAAKLASKQTLKAGDNMLKVGGWEIGINGTTGVIYHALMK